MTAANATAAPVKLDRKDFVSDQEVRWCPGCGDYAILTQVQKVCADLGIARENFVFVSGIGCSSRFPYYMNTYGFHAIHGRAPAVATGIKCLNPELQVWVATGDGDGLSIGGNHFIHTIRRNPDINILLFNNRIYGLTKGQYSPTSEHGKKTKSTPMGSIEQPLNPICVALAAEATFAARTLDIDPKHLSATLARAARHKGTSFVEIYQNCNIFNDQAFYYFADRPVRADRVLYIEHGQPMIFGKDRNQGIVLDGMDPRVVEFDPAHPPENLLKHNEAMREPTLAYFLSRLDYPDFPIPLGVFRAVQHPTYDEELRTQIQTAKAQTKHADLQQLLLGGETWEVN